MTTSIRNLTVLLIAAFICAVAQPVIAGNIVGVDATTLGLPDATPVNTVTNSGTAGNFSAIIGTPVTASQPSNNNAGVLIQGLDFSGDKMKSAVSQSGVGISGNVPYTVQAWVFNPGIGSEEAIVSWGHRNGPDGSNMGFHQGTHPAFGAVGHWGSPDIGYGNAGADINATTSQWAHLAHSYDGAGNQKVYINGALNNTEAGITCCNPHLTFNDLSPTHLYLGSESDNGNENSTPIAFSGIIARVDVDSGQLSDQQILDSFNAQSPLFFDGIQPSAVPEPSAFALGLLAVTGIACLGWRRRQRSSKSIFSILAVLVSAGVFVGPTTSVQAQNNEWNWIGPAGGSWTNPANWPANAQAGSYPGQVAGDVAFRDSLNGDSSHIILNSAIPNALDPWNNFGCCAGTFTLEVQSAGSVAINNVWFGRNGGTGTLVVDGGSFMNNNGSLFVGESGGSDTTGFIEVRNGGTVTASPLRLGESRNTNTALVTIEDGTISASDLTIFNPGPLQNITLAHANALLQVNGNQETKLQGFIDNGGILAATGFGLLGPTFDGQTTSVTAFSNIAAVPEPSTMLLSVLALASFGAIGWRRRRRA